MAGGEVDLGEIALQEIVAHGPGGRGRWGLGGAGLSQLDDHPGALALLSAEGDEGPRGARQ
jgi:hypothetical protein